MKTIILISSIFYIIGLKIGNKIDLSPKCNPVKKIISNTIPSKKTEKAYKLEIETTETEAKTDSLKSVKKEETAADKTNN